MINLILIKGLVNFNCFLMKYLSLFQVSVIIVAN